MISVIIRTPSTRDSVGLQAYLSITRHFIAAAQRHEPDVHVNFPLLSAAGNRSSSASSSSLEITSDLTQQSFFLSTFNSSSFVFLVFTSLTSSFPSSKLFFSSYNFGNFSLQPLVRSNLSIFILSLHWFTIISVFVYFYFCILLLMYASLKFLPSFLA